MKTIWTALALVIATTAGPAAADASAADPYADWEQVLGTWVDGSGRVDFAGLKSDRAALDRFVAWVGATAPWSDPQTFPTASDRIAYHLNAYNALAMAGVLDAGIPEDLDGFFARYRFFKRTAYVVGGRELSLHEYEHEVIRPLGEPRVHFVLNCMSAGCPRLRREPLRADILETQLQAAAEEFFRSERHVRVTDAGRTVRLSEILDWFREDFVGEDGSAADLLRYVNSFRDEPVPTTAEVELIDYDWSVISQG